ncbi:hypothetical protein RHMOL_Rhmol03G0116000 [Rhododendron molle]|uniref:Uncharacterized protein n=1 Tax=Rhododendron molle TaxID=49168 RepID=A0ACC0PEE8_RHOML|nr:hypothetical protein RHMOL_Rhmol03G0116000 [Rhododendron molle]
MEALHLLQQATLYVEVSDKYYPSSARPMIKVLSHFVVKLQLPCIMWLVAYKPKRFSLSWFTNWICIILGVMLMVLGPIGALRGLILQAKDFQYYS